MNFSRNQKIALIIFGFVCVLSLFLLSLSSYFEGKDDPEKQLSQYLIHPDAPIFSEVGPGFISIYFVRMDDSSPSVYLETRMPVFPSMRREYLSSIKYPLRWNNLTITTKVNDDREAVKYFEPGARWAGIETSNWGDYPLHFHSEYRPDLKIKTKKPFDYSRINRIAGSITLRYPRNLNSVDLKIPDSKKLAELENSPKIRISREKDRIILKGDIKELETEAYYAQFTKTNDSEEVPVRCFLRDRIENFEWECLDRPDSISILWSDRSYVRTFPFDLKAKLKLYKDIRVDKLPLTVDEPEAYFAKISKDENEKIKVDSHLTKNHPRFLGVQAILDKNYVPYETWYHTRKWEDQEVIFEYKRDFDRIKFWFLEELSNSFEEEKVL